MYGGNGKELIFIILILIAIVAVVVVGKMQGGDVVTSPSTGEETTKTEETIIPSITPTKTVTITKAPADLLPTSVAGFTKISEDKDYESKFTGDVAAAAISFKPSDGSKYAGTVRHLTLYSHKFDTTEHAATIVNGLLGSDTVLELEINGKSASYTYNKSTGRALMLIDGGKTIIYCFAEPPTGASSFDELSLQNAVILGFGAVNF